MPLPTAAALYAVVVSALPTAVPVLGVAALSFALINSHEPDRLDVARLSGTPEAAAECIARNVGSMNIRLAAVVQPLFGTEVMGVILKSDRVGQPLMNIVIQEAGAGSQAEFRPLVPPEQQPDVITKIIAGC